MQSSQKPECIAMAGVNGSGKSTLFAEIGSNKIQFINPDVIAREIAPNDFNNPLVSIKAGREAIKQTRAALDNKKSFAFETTLSGNREIKVLMEAQSKGFYVELNYIGLRVKELSVLRVNKRVSQGGHDIPLEALNRRYDKSINNLPKAMLVADNINIYDNSDEKRSVLYKKVGEKVIYKSDNLPGWADTAIKKYEIVKSFRDKADRIGDKTLQKLHRYLHK